MAFQKGTAVVIAYRFLSQFRPDEVLRRSGRPQKLYIESVQISHHVGGDIEWLRIKNEQGWMVRGKKLYVKKKRGNKRPRLKVVGYAIYFPASHFIKTTG